MDGTDIVFTGELLSALCGYTLHLTTFDIYFHYGITGNDFASTLFDDTFDAIKKGIGSTLNIPTDKVTQDMVEYANRYGLDDRDGLINYGMALVQKYGEGSSELACEMYDTIARLQNADVEPAEPADLPEYGEVARSINGALKQSPDGKLIGDPVSRLVKRAGADTMLHNAKRDGAEFAWIPSGDSCAFCTMIASRGWQRASKKTIEGDHADHIHANCQCEFAIRFSKDMDVAGYHPEKLREEYDNAADGSWRDKLNAIRRESYQSEKVNLDKTICNGPTFVTSWIYL